MALAEVLVAAIMVLAHVAHLAQQTAHRRHQHNQIRQQLTQQTATKTLTNLLMAQQIIAAGNQALALVAHLVAGLHHRKEDFFV